MNLKMSNGGEKREKDPRGAEQKGGGGGGLRKRLGQKD